MNYLQYEQDCRKIALNKAEEIQIANQNLSTGTECQLVQKTKIEVNDMLVDAENIYQWLVNIVKP